VNDLLDAANWLVTPAHWWGSAGLFNRLWEHLQYCFVAVVLAIAIGVPVGLLVGHTRRGIFLTTNVAGVVRAIPTIGVVVLVFKLQPLTAWPVIIALTLLAIPPILTNTAVGVSTVEPEIRDAAEGMGMTGRQVLREAELPLALPLIFAGIRSAVSQVIATATIASYVGLGGLGRYIIDGLAQRDFPVVYAGAIAVALLALTMEAALALLQRYSVSPGLRSRTSTRSARFRVPGPLQLQRS
jgi:osmoprotectant transport system permease protein